MTRVVALALFTLGIVTVGRDALAADKKLPQTGLLSSTQNSGTSDNRGGIWGLETGRDKEGKALEEKESGSAPISGSVTQDGKSWRLVVSNRGRGSYSASMKLEQVNSSGTTVKTDYYTFSLTGGQTSTRTVDVVSNATDANLILEKWRKTGGPSEEKPAKKEKS